MARLNLTLVVVALFASACGGNSMAPSSTPPVTTPPVVTTFTLSGTVTSTTGVAVSGATIRIVDGANAGKFTTTNATGAYTFTGLLVSGMTVNAAATNFFGTSKGVTLTSSQTVDFQLAPTPLFTMAGFGNNVFNLPTTVARVRVTGHFVDNGGNSNFIVHLNGFSLVNEILRTVDYAGTHLTTGGGIIEIVSSGSIQWTFTEVR